MGRLTCQLFPKQAPKAVANFIGLAKGTKDWTDPRTGLNQHDKPYYNGTIFHRVIPGFMIQGGDPTGTGMGDPGYKFDDEFDPNLNFDLPGRLAMANSGPNTNGSQFFITDRPTRSSTSTTPSSASAMTPASRWSRPSPASRPTARQAAHPGGAEEGDHRPRRPAAAAVRAAPNLLPSRTRPNHNHPSAASCPRCSANREIPHESRSISCHLQQEPTPSSPPPKARSPSASLSPDAPITVKNFIELAEGGKEWTHPTTRKKSTDKLFDGTIFHRVIPDFMIQGGDPAGTGMGGPGYRFQDETKGSPHKFDKPGKLAMANSGPGTNGCQFFITVAPTPWLTGNHTIFGEVVEGQEIVDQNLPGSPRRPGQAQDACRPRIRGHRARRVTLVPTPSSSGAPSIALFAMGGKP